jgi:hypothetical protein
MGNMDDSSKVSTRVFSCASFLMSLMFTTTVAPEARPKVSSTYLPLSRSAILVTAEPMRFHTERA